MIFFLDGFAIDPMEQVNQREENIKKEGTPKQCILFFYVFFPKYPIKQSS